jgi:ribonucleotide reductase alpha subunit
MLIEPQSLLGKLSDTSTYSSFKEKPSLDKREGFFITFTLVWLPSYLE